MSDRALIVVTRVAAPWRGIPSEEWVANREHLLDAVCAQTFRHMTQPHTWVWRTCEQRADQVAEIRDRAYPDAVLAVGAVGTVDAAAPNHDKFVTARIDSDDAWLPHELDALAGRWLPPDTIINYHMGWQLDWPTGRISNHGWPNREQQGPFLALTHDGRGRMLGVGGDHTKVRARYEHVRHVTRRAWIQVTHGGNIKNAWRNRTPLDREHRRKVLERSHIRWEKP
jgi:hypothetical protein